jgi:hypothetical protein
MSNDNNIVNSENSNLNNQKNVIKRYYKGYFIEIVNNEEDLYLDFNIEKNNVYYKKRFSHKDLKEILGNSDQQIFSTISDWIKKRRPKINIRENKNKLELKLNDKTLILEESLNVFNKMNELTELSENMTKKGNMNITIIILLGFILFLNIGIFLYCALNNKKEKDGEILNIIVQEFNDFKKNISDIVKIDELKNDVEGEKIITDINENILISMFSDLEKIKKVIYSIKVQYTNVNMTKTNVIHLSNYPINSISLFPSSRNIVAVSYKSIIILDENLKIIQKIENKHNERINYVAVYDDYNFATCSNDKSIKTWFKSKYDKDFSINITINNAHNDYIMKVIYDSKGNLFSGSYNDNITKWELKNGSYKNITSLKHEEDINSFLLFDDNTLISGDNRINIWDLRNNSIIKSYDNINISWNNCIEKIDENKIMICNNTNLIILSMQNFEIIKVIDNTYVPIAIKLIVMKGIILVSGENNKINNLYNLNIYRKDNFELIQTIDKQKEITDFIELKNHSIVSSCGGGTLTVWSC